ncbi:glycosyl transferase [Sulfuriferula plumbiphila]|uniref:Glycosyl transferase n=1 Tax=Sulfuriferula plumbiphila TaxID=171865 RepID=A0A512LA05_9PROT|nr:glycosyltransferase family 2 protein [Sulfuriferula plumbiphila]BBP05725.1 glycosyl transferase [Sulfuriferula plumbiphila]GEP31313.1 glycosyl transferase [Sulfuriferula plumbiphila]
MIQVLLATYNGEAFLAEQLDSLLAQKGGVCTVLARDDGSTDTTLDILQRYAQSFPSQIVLGEKQGRLGAIGSFDWLLSQSSAPYIAFCDQDDVWEPDKLHILLERMQALEARLGKDTPILVHSDLAVVNRNLQRIHPSFWTYSGLDARRHGLAQLLISNTVTGCAMLANRALVERATPIPQEAVMHDHWFALVAAALGHVEPVYESLVAYRQHGRNAVGAQAYGWRTMLGKLISGCGHTDISKLRHQAEVLYRRYGDYLEPDHAGFVAGFSKLQDKSWLARRFFMLRHGILRPGVVRNLGLFFCVRLAREGQQKRDI